MQVWRWLAVGALLVAGCESTEAKYARALQVYEAERTLFQRAEENYQATYDLCYRNIEASKFPSSPPLSLESDSPKEVAAKAPGDDLLEVFNKPERAPVAPPVEARPAPTEAELKAKLDAIEKETLDHKFVKAAQTELDAARKRLDHAAERVKELAPLP